MIKIKIDLESQSILNQDQSKYIFETLCIIMGVPWKFVEQDDEEIDIYYGNNQPNKCKVNIRSRKNHLINPHIIQFQNLTFIEDKGKENSPFLNQDDCHHFYNDIIFSCFYLLTGVDEKNIERNKWDQHNIKDSILHKFNTLHRPIVNEYANFLKQLFIGKFDFIPLWPENKQAALVLSHDVDYPEMIRSIELLRYLYKNKLKSKRKSIADIISGKETFWQFQNYMMIEKKYNVRSAFYFCSFKGNLARYFITATDTFYDIRKSNFIQLAQELKSEGFEIGLHSSYLAYQSKKQFLTEVNKLKETFNLNEVGHRHHYWHTNPENPSETCQLHHECGLSYDSSISFEQHSGFRYSICTPYRLWHNGKNKSLDILQLPPTLMDDHLFGYKHLSNFRSYQENIDSLIDAILMNNGLFVANFHDRILNDTFFPNWGSSYEYLLNQIQKTNKFHIDTPMNINNYWKEREIKIRSKIQP